MLKFIVAIVFLSLVGCVPPVAETKQRVPMGLSTVEHDGHKFVLFRDGFGVAMMLHPDDGKTAKGEGKHAEGK